MTCCRQDLDSQGAKMQWKKYFSQGIIENNRKIELLTGKRLGELI